MRPPPLPFPGHMPHGPLMVRPPFMPPGAIGGDYDRLPQPFFGAGPGMFPGLGGGGFGAGGGVPGLFPGSGLPGGVVPPGPGRGGPGMGPGGRGGFGPRQRGGGNDYI